MHLIFVTPRRKPTKFFRRFLRACLKPSDKDGDESASKNLGRGKEFALTIFPKSSEFVEPAEKTFYYPATGQHNELM